MKKIEDIVFIYGGRFQPPHPGHYKVYKWLIDTFGQDNVYIATSDKTDIKEKNSKSPFNFEDKKLIWTKLFKIPEDKIIMSRNPAFAPTEILSNFPKDKTAYVAVVSVKDVPRYEKGKYFEPYPLDVNGKPMSLKKMKEISEPYENKGYYLIAPLFESGINATKIRNIFLDTSKTDEEKIEELKKIYGYFDKEIYNFMKKKIELLRK